MKKADITRQYIIEQSAPIFNTKGLAGTAMSDVMHATRMAKGGLYGHFASKQDLVNAIVDYNLKQLGDLLHQAISEAASPSEQLFAYLDFFARPNQFPVKGGCPAVNFGSEADDTNPVVKAKVRDLIVKAQGTAEIIIKKGIKTGFFRKNFDARSFAIMMFTVIEGGIMIGRVMESNHQMSIVIKMLKEQILSQEA